MPADNGSTTGGSDPQSGEPPEVVLPMEFPFPNPTDETGYRVFPDEVENDPLVFFHGTALSKLRPILVEGFQPRVPLQSVSFARQSSLALRYACERRCHASPEGCIIAVRFESIAPPWIRDEPFGVYVYDMSWPHKIIGYCIVPADYRFR